MTELESEEEGFVHSFRNITPHSLYKEPKNLIP